MWCSENDTSHRQYILIYLSNKGLKTIRYDCLVQNIVSITIVSLDFPPSLAWSTETTHEAVLLSHRRYKWRYKTIFFELRKLEWLVQQHLQHFCGQVPMELFKHSRQRDVAKTVHCHYSWSCKYSYIPIWICWWYLLRVRVPWCQRRELQHIAAEICHEWLFRRPMTSQGSLEYRQKPKESIKQMKDQQSVFWLRQGWMIIQVNLFSPAHVHLAVCSTKLPFQEPKFS